MQHFSRKFIDFISLKKQSPLSAMWVLFFVAAFITAIIKWLNPDIPVEQKNEIFKVIVDGMFDSAEIAVMKIALPLAGVMTFFMGLLAVGEKAGAIGFLARLVGPFFNRLFPEVPPNHPASGHMIMNFSANMLGLDNAATPFGLKAMQSLQELNPQKEVASNAQIMFLVLHSAGPVLIPLSIMAQRSIYKAADPSDIFILGAPPRAWRWGPGLRLARRAIQPLVCKPRPAPARHVAAGRLRAPWRYAPQVLPSQHAPALLVRLAWPAASQNRVATG